MPESWQVSLVHHPVRGKITLRWNIFKSIWNIFLILVPCRLTKEPSDSNKRRQTQDGPPDAVLCKCGVRPVLLICPYTASLFLAVLARHSQFRQKKKKRHSSSTARFSPWQLPLLHLQFPIEIWSFDLNAYKRTNTFQRLVLKHGTPECRNAGTPERRNTKTRNTKLLKPGTHEK